MNHLRPAIVLIALFTLLTGLILPLAFVGLGQLAFPEQANGSLIRRDGQIIGSALIGQNFTASGYFHPRPSATVAPDPKDPSRTIAAPYAADNSGGSNLAPSSKALIERVRGDVASLGARDVPADAVTSSASGLDPDISPENAALQIPRVAAARQLDAARIAALVAAHTKPRLLGFIGEPRVNVLALNLALDALKPLPAAPRAQ